MLAQTIAIGLVLSLGLAQIPGSIPASCIFENGRFYFDPNLVMSTPVSTATVPCAPGYDLADLGAPSDYASALFGVYFCYSSPGQPFWVRNVNPGGWDGLGLALPVGIFTIPPGETTIPFKMGRPEWMTEPVAAPTLKYSPTSQATLFSPLYPFLCGTVTAKASTGAGGIQPTVGPKLGQDEVGASGRQHRRLKESL